MLEVRQNLIDFLSQARSTTNTPESDLYWTDAICIQQNNLLERNSQVAMMGDIYSRAQWAHLWPGIITGLDGFARFCMTRGKKLVESNGNTSRDQDHERNALQPLKDSVWAQIVHNEYWGRAWIVQELFLPRHVLIIIGKEVVTFAELYMGLVYGFSGLNEASILQFRSLRKGKTFTRSKSLAELVRDFYGKRCFVPRDRFYSLYSLCEEREGLVVDYAMPKYELVFQILGDSRKKACLCSAVLVFRTLTGDETSSVRQDRGHFLEFDCLGLDIWVATKCSEDSDVDNMRHDSGQGYLSVLWISDACQSGRLDMRRRFFIHSNHITRRIKTGKFPCYVPEVDRPDRMNKLSEELWEMPVYAPESAHERTEYIRANGFSAKLGADNFTYTVRIAFWAIAAWTDEPQKPDLGLTEEARDRGHSSTFQAKEPNLL
ncbi:hypothetical protein EJ02DRAFT_140258 [Clathrospora elynae]|uniref:Heterokaryon incompatibility domain-containing protein n=1 Tax=Clathrospora elynae TaxID=706981 RepID=A0A6A5T5G7_9PLEO|nr:hypothetical protein EJ02DRAFT_140258 [Clathrospora elynae]